MVIRLLVPALVLGTLSVALSGFVVASQADSGSSLTGSPFNGSDGTLDTNSSIQHAIDPVSPAQDNIYAPASGGGGNPQEADLCETGKTGTLGSDKYDLSDFYVGQEPGSNGAPPNQFLYLGWKRAGTSGDANIDFELNRTSTGQAGCVNPTRSPNDYLVEYNYLSGPKTFEINLYKWVTTSGPCDIGTLGAGGCWQSVTLPAGSEEHSVSSDLSFGEVVFDLNATGVYTSTTCTTIASGFAKSRSSQSATSSLQDYVSPVPKTISNCGAVTVNKHDDAGHTVDHATFGLFTDAAATQPATTAGNDTCVTGVDVTAGTPNSVVAGSCSFLDVFPGTYWVKETVVPTGYGIDTAITQVTVTAGATTTASHTYVDPRHPGAVSLTKVDDTGAPLNGATFGIFTDANATQPAPVGQGGNQTCTTSGGSAGPPATAAGCTFSGLQPGTYYVKETAAPQHYAADTTIATVTVVSDQTTAISRAFVDQRDPGSVTVDKTDDLGNGLNGAVFGIYTTQAATTLVTPYGNGNNTCTTSGGSVGVAATCTFSGILPGTYYVKEQSAPQHYTIDATVASVSVTSDNNTVVSSTFVDPRNPGSVTLTKTDDTGAPLNGAQFGLYSDAGATTLATTLASGGNNTCTTTGGSAGPPATPAVCTFANVLPGTYYVKEISAPAHYDPSARVAQVTVTSDVQSAIPTAFVDPRHPGGVSLTKVDDIGNGVNGASFGIFTDAAGTQAAPVAQGGNNTCTTSGGGVNIAATCSFTGLLPGTYYVKETVAAPHHAADATVATVVVVSDQTTSISRAFVDPRNPGGVSLTKVDDTGAGVNGATFGIYSNAGATTLATVNQTGNNTCSTSGGTATAAASCSFSGLQPGTYYVKEISAPAHYAPDTTIATVTVVSDQVTAIQGAFVDQRNPGAIEVTKTDDAGAAVGGATFGLYTDAGATTPAATSAANDTCTTANNTGTCTFASVLPGTYWVKETSAPAHYFIDTSIKQVTVSSDATASVGPFVDGRHPGTVTIAKVDDAGNGVNGAQFGIYSNAGATTLATVAQGGNNTCTTSGGGVATAATCSFSGLLPATYYVKEISAPFGYTPDAAIQAVTVTSDTTTSPAQSFVDPRLPSGISVTKTVNQIGTTTQANPLLVESGSTLSYLVTVTNTGQLPLTITALSDSLHANLPASCTQGLGSTLAVGAHFTCAYTTTATTDADNVASATGTDQFGRTPSAQDQTFVHVLAPAIAVSKTGAANAHVGDVVTYTISVTNPGNTGLSSVTVDDPLCDAAPTLQSKAGGNQDTVLDPGETWTYTCGHTVTATDGKSFTNTVQVQGTDVLGTTVTATGTAVTAVLSPAIAVSKTGPTQAHVGDTLTYTLVVTNPGDAPLSNVVVTDDKCASAPTLQTRAGGNQDNVLDPGEMWTYTCSYVVQTADGTSVVNHAGVAGTDVLGKTVTGAAQWTTSVLHPSITIKKTANPVSVTGTGSVTYTYVVTNTGDTPLSNVTVTDDVIGAIGSLGTLAPGASGTLTKTVTVTTSTPPTNTGTATGTDPLGLQVQATDKATISVVLGEVITQPTPPAVAPQTLPRTGAPLQREGELAALFVVLGALLIGWSRRRPEQEEA